METDSVHWNEYIYNKLRVYKIGIGIRLILLKINRQ